MKIAKHVGDLLYDYECVVIPGLGGFLTQEMPSSINPVTHQFRPPYKQISFNAYLKTNDGLLINYVARQEGMDYKVAKEQVDQFVLQCDRALKQGKKINFHNVGQLYLNENGQVVFQQDANINYNADAFGLTSFVSPAISRSTAEERLHEKVTAKVNKVVPKTTSDRKLSVSEKEQKKSKSQNQRLVSTAHKSPYRQQLTFLALLILAMFVGWGFMNKEKIQKFSNNYSSIIPLFSSMPNTYLLDKAHKISFLDPNSKSGLLIMKLFSHESGKKAIPAASNTKPIKPNVPQPRKSVVSKTAVVASVTPDTKQETPVVIKSTSPAVTVSNEKKVPTQEHPAPKPQNIAIINQKHYYIIAGAFKDRLNADALIHKLRLKGYRAVQAGLTSSGLMRVAFGEYDNLKQAESQLLLIRKNENPSAWIFKR